MTWLTGYLATWLVGSSHKYKLPDEWQLIQSNIGTNMGTYLVTTILVLLSVSETIAAAKLSETPAKIYEAESVDNSKKGKKYPHYYIPFILQQILLFFQCFQNLLIFENAFKCL